MAKYKVVELDEDWRRYSIANYFRQNERGRDEPRDSITLYGEPDDIMELKVRMLGIHGHSICQREVDRGEAYKITSGLIRALNVITADQSSVYNKEISSGTGSITQANLMAAAARDMYMKPEYRNTYLTTNKIMDYINEVDENGHPRRKHFINAVNGIAE